MGFGIEYIATVVNFIGHFRICIDVFPQTHPAAVFAVQLVGIENDESLLLLGRQALQQRDPAIWENWFIGFTHAAYFSNSSWVRTSFGTRWLSLVPSQRILP